MCTTRELVHSDRATERKCIPQHGGRPSRIHFDSDTLSGTARRTECRQMYVFQPGQSQDKRPKELRRLVALVVFGDDDS